MRTYLKYPKKEKQRKPKQRTKDWCSGGGKLLRVLSIYDEDELWAKKAELVQCGTCKKKLEVWNTPSDWDILQRIPKHKSY
jgi:hypothetical protein